MAENKPNSHAYVDRSNEQAEKKVSKVVKGNVKTRKNVARKIRDTFVAEDISNVGSYALMDVLVPAAKKAISDIVVNGLDMILYGEVGRSKRGNSSYVSYSNYSSRRDIRDDRRDSRSRTSYGTEDIIFDSRGEAEEVRTRMEELIDTYGIVTVADMYDLAGLSCNYTDNKYGWSSMRTAEVVRVRDGYVIKLPKAMPID